MTQVNYLRCRYCGDLLENRSEPYCPPCNLYLCYRAMPILLGMVLTGHLAPGLKSFPIGAAKPPAASCEPGQVC